MSTYSTVKYAIDGADIVPSDEGRLGVWINFASLCTGNKVISIIDNSLDTVFGLKNNSSCATQFDWVNGSSVIFSTTGANLATSTWYFVEMIWKKTTPLRMILINGDNEWSNSSTFDSTEVTSGFLEFGDNTNKDTEYYLDNLIISNDSTRDLYALSTLTAYPGSPLPYLSLGANIKSIGAVSTSLEDVKVGNVNVELVHGGSLSTYFKNPDFIKQPAILTVSANSSVATLFVGKTTDIKLKGCEISFSIVDKMMDLLNKKIGSSDNPIRTDKQYVDEQNQTVSYLYGYHNPADIVWILLTKYGEFDTIESISNSNIDYSSWLTWKDNCYTMGLQLNVSIEGDSIQDILSNISKFTNSIVISEPSTGKLYFELRLPEYDIDLAIDYYFDWDNIVDIELNVNTDPLINDYTVYFGYDKEADKWEGFSQKKNAESIIKYGLCSEVEQDTKVWHKNGTSAEQQAQRYIDIYKQPRPEISITTNLEGCLVSVGQVLGLSDEILGYTNAKFRVLKITKSLLKGSVQIEARLISGIEPEWYWSYVYGGDVVPNVGGWSRKTVYNETISYDSGSTYYGCALEGSTYFSFYENSPLAQSNGTLATIVTGGATSLTYNLTSKLRFPIVGLLGSRWELGYPAPSKENTAPPPQVVNNADHPLGSQCILYLDEYTSGDSLIKTTTICNDLVFRLEGGSFFYQNVLQHGYDMTQRVKIDINIYQPDYWESYTKYYAKGATITLDNNTSYIIPRYETIIDYPPRPIIMRNDTAYAGFVTIQFTPYPLCDYIDNSILYVRPPFYYDNILHNVFTTVTGVSAQMASNATGNSAEWFLKASASTTNPFRLAIEDGTKIGYYDITTEYDDFKSVILTLQGSEGHVYVDGIEASMVVASSASNCIYWGWKNASSKASHTQIDYMRYTIGRIFSSSTATAPIVSSNAYAISSSGSAPSPVTNLTLTETSNVLSNGTYVPQIKINFTESTLLGSTYLIDYKHASASTYTFIGETPLTEYFLDCRKGLNFVRVRTRKGVYSTSGADSPIENIDIEGQEATVEAPGYNETSTDLLVHFDTNLLAVDGTAPEASSTATILNDNGWQGKCLTVAEGQHIEYKKELPSVVYMHLKINLDVPVASMATDQYFFAREAPETSIYIDHTLQQLILSAYSSTICTIDCATISSGSWNTIQAMLNYSNKSFQLMLNEDLKTGYGSN